MNWLDKLKIKLRTRPLSARKCEKMMLEINEGKRGCEHPEEHLLK